MPFNDQANPLNYPTNSRDAFRRFRVDRAPTTQDFQNFKIGDFWIDTSAEELYFLVDKSGTSLWILLSSGPGPGVESLTGNTGGPVPADGAENINIIGTGNVTVAGNPGTNTLTISDTGSNPETLTGNTGGAVGPDGANNINFVGMAPLTVAGNPGTNTLTIENDGTIAENYPTDSGTAIPAFDTLNVFGGTGIDTSGVGNTITINSTGEHATQYTENTGTATPAANNLNVLGVPGTNGIDTAGAGSTVTIAMKSPFTVEDFSFEESGAGSARTLETKHTDNTNALSDAILAHTVGGTSGGDAFDLYSIGASRSYAWGPDTSDSQIFKMTTAAAATVSPSSGTSLFEMTDDGLRTLPLQPAFEAFLSADINNATGNTILATVVWDSIRFDKHSDFNTGTGTFTAPITGIYNFNCSVRLEGLISATNVNCFGLITTSNEAYETMFAEPGSAIATAVGGFNFSGSITADLDAGDTAICQVEAGAGAQVVKIGADDPNGASISHFSGFLVS